MNLIELLYFRVKAISLWQNVHRWPSLSPTDSLVLVNTLTRATTPLATSEHGQKGRAELQRDRKTSFEIIVIKISQSFQKCLCLKL